MRAHGIERVVLSAPCTQGSEPDKSPFMYAVQRVLLRSALLRPVAELISASFYARDGKLRPAWRLFTREGAPIDKVLEPDNEGLLAAIEPYASMSAWYWVNPLRPPSRQEAEIALRRPRVVGLKLHAYWHRFSPEQGRDALRWSADAGKPVYLILNFGWLRHARRLLAEFPSTPFIFGYGGMPYFDALWEEVRGVENAYVDLTSFHLDERAIGDLVRALGPERCLYGTDCPYNFPGPDGRFDYGRTLARVRGLGLTPAAQTQVLEGNARRLLF